MNNHWTEVLVNPADPNKEPEVPYIKLHHDGDSFWQEPWHWQLFLGDTNERNAQWRTHGIAMTKLGAKWAAHKAWRSQLKRQRNKARPPEIIRLRPPSNG